MTIDTHICKTNPRTQHVVGQPAQAARIALLLTSSLLWCMAVNAQTDPESCILERVANGEPDLTVAQIRLHCAALQNTTVLPKTGTAADASGESRIQYRWRAEHEIENREYAVSLYQPNYMMFTHDSKFDAADSIYASIDPDFDNLKKEEMKYQVSVKFPLWRQMFGRNTDLYFGYTQTAWWQLFSDEGITSAPFRETNYEPEIFLRHFTHSSLPFGGALSALDLALVHQSNGRSEPLSRSWNRVMGRAVLDYGELGLLLRLWYRIPEDDDEDDNPDTEDYYGYGDIRASWAPNRNTFGIMWRPGEKKNGLELTWSYPLTERLRVYAQWWHGYGESMIDYDRKVNRFGVGIAINDFLANHR